MKDTESLLVLLSLMFGILMYIFILIRGPRLGIINKLAYFDKKRLPVYLKFLSIVIVASVSIGLIITRDTALLLKYVGLNLLFAVILGPNIFMYRRR